MFLLAKEYRTDARQIERATVVALSMEICLSSDNHFFSDQITRTATKT